MGRTCLGRCPAPRNPVIIMESNKPAICVFCGSSFGANPAFRAVAREIGSGIAKMGFSLVFGGGGNGLMGDVARATQEGGAAVKGIIPAFLSSLEPPTSAEEELIVTPHLQERKAIMLAVSDAFVVLLRRARHLRRILRGCGGSAARCASQKPIIVAINADGYF